MVGNRIKPESRMDRPAAKEKRSEQLQWLPAVAMLVSFFLALPLHTALHANSRTVRLDELKQHSTAQSCWIAINGSVYDITDYLGEHASVHKFSLLPWCGKDATSGWNNKNNTGKPHSRKASIQLKRYKIGELE